MTTGDWNQVWLLFQQLRDLPPHLHAERLAAEDPAIAEEVRVMLLADEPEPEPPAPGRVYGRYTLLAPLGSGGMGDVFSARDAELGRTVAVKFVGARGRMLPSAVERLIREAQAASALNHPSLVTVHDVLRFDTGAALVTELINGQSLRVFCGVARPIPQVAAWGAQIARALAAAHAQGIVHSDVKPENVMLRPDGLIKVLDFGLAQNAGIADTLEHLPLGTLGYMSPEQLRGEALTGASDVFSLGATLVELATGTHPFLASTAGETTRNIGQQQIDVTPPPLPGGKAFATLLRNMLDKDPARRPAMAAVAASLDRIAAALGNSRPRYPYWLGAAATFFILAALALSWRPAAPALPRFASPVALTKYSGIEQQPSFSPDGTRIAFVWSGPDGRQDDLYIRSVNAMDEPPRRVTNDANHEFTPAWSPDGTRLAWHRRALDGSDGEIWVAPIIGLESGTPRLVAKVVDHSGFDGIAWTPDSAALLSRDRTPLGNTLVRISVSDGAKSLFTREPATNEKTPVVSPDGQQLLFYRLVGNTRLLCVVSLVSPGATPECRGHQAGATSATWMLDSRGILLAEAGALWIVDSRALRSPSQKVTEGVFSNLTTDAAGRRYAFNRTIRDANIWSFDTTTGQATQILASSEEDSEPHFSPDGRYILFRSNRTGAHELYLCNRDGSGLRQLTRLGVHSGSARFSPDGRWIAFDAFFESAGNRSGPRLDNIYVMPAAGGTPRRLTDDTVASVVPNWSADSRWIYYTHEKSRECWKVSLDGGAPVRVSEEEMWGAVESADGRWIWFERPSTGTGLWRRPVQGGPEQRIPGTENLAYRTWEVRGATLAFLRNGPGAGFYRRSIAPNLGGPLSRIAPAPKRLLHGPATMSLSPDGKGLLYTSEDLTIGDIYVLTPESASP